MIGGEEVTRVSLSGTLAQQAFALNGLSGRFTGLDIAAAGRIADGQAEITTTLAASETARLALALSRMGLSPSLADVVGAQGDLRATGQVTLGAGRLALTNWRGASGGTTWMLDAQHSGDATQLDLSGENFRLDALPSLAGTAGSGKLSARLR